MGAEGIQKTLGAAGIKSDGAKSTGTKRRRNTNGTEKTEPKEAHIAYPVVIIYIYIYIVIYICLYIDL